MHRLFVYVSVPCALLQKVEIELLVEFHKHGTAEKEKLEKLVQEVKTNIISYILCCHDTAIYNEDLKKVVN